MSATNDVVVSKKDLSTLTRARFEPGMLLQHEDLEQLNDYTRELSRLLFRSFFGCGVVCGLTVSPSTNACGTASLTVQAGLALDGLGDPVHVPRDQTFVLDSECDPELTGPLWVVLRRAPKRCAPRTSLCESDDDGQTVCTRERDGFEIRVVRAAPRCTCGLPDQANTLGAETECKCAVPTDPWHTGHYQGVCDGGCGGGTEECGCDAVLLARLTRTGESRQWTPDHAVRRFIRPVLMRDPRAQAERPEQPQGPQGGMVEFSTPVRRQELAQAPQPVDAASPTPVATAPAAPAPSAPAPAEPQKDAPKPTRKR